MALLAGCASTATVAPRSTSTSTAVTHAQVLSWVTPTLANGASFAASVPADATAEQVFAASRPLNAGATVSQRELAEIPWTGALQGSEKTLVKELHRIEALTAVAPGPAYLDQLHSAILGAEGALRSLQQALKN